MGDQGPQNDESNVSPDLIPVLEEHRHAKGNKMEQDNNNNNFNLSDNNNNNKVILEEDNKNDSYISNNNNSNPNGSFEPPHKDSQDESGNNVDRWQLRLSMDEGNKDQDAVPSPPKHRPYFVVTMIVTCIAMFLASLGENDWKLASFKVNPLIGPDSTVFLIQLGAKLTDRIVHHGEGWRIIASLFLHAGLVHLLLNMLMLWRIGAGLEEAYGWIRIGIIYFASGIFGVLMSAIFLPQVPGVGASGAIFGLVGALFGEFVHNPNDDNYPEGKCLYLTSLVMSSILGLAIGLFPLVDNFGHIGGWLCGGVSGLVFLGMGNLHSKSCVVLVSFAIWIAMLIIGFAVLYSSVDGNEWCSWCANLSCLRDVPWWDCTQQNCKHVIRTYSNGTQSTFCEPY